MILALIQDNTVTNIVTVDGDDFDKIQDYARVYQNAIDITDMAPMPEIGWRWTGTKFTMPDGSDYKVDMRITRLAFRNRFTSTEKAALYNAMNGPQGVLFKIYIDDLAASTFVDLNRPETISGVNTLAAVGLITPQRAAEILTTLPTPVERYRGE